MPPAERGSRFCSPFPARSNLGQNTRVTADEHFGTLYPAADRDLAVDARRAGVRHRGLWPVAGGCVAQCRFSDDHGGRQLSGREPGYDGLRRRHAARAAIRGDPRSRPDDLDERRRHDLDHLAIRPVAQHRRRGAGRAAGDQRRQRAAAEGFAEPADLSQDQPRRPPGIDLCGSFRRDANLPHRRLCLHDPGAKDVHRAGCLARSRIFGQKPYAVHVQVNPAALAARGIGFEDVRNALATATVDRPRAISKARTKSITLDTNDQLFNAAAYNNVIIAYRNGAPVRVEGCRRRDQLGAERPHRRLVFGESPPRAWRFSAKPAPTPSRWSTRSRR